MTTDELARALDDPAAGPEVRVGLGEFEGPLVVRRPLRLIGGGPASVIWARRGPVLTVCAPDVELRDLVLEVTEEADGVALAVQGEARTRPLSVSNVRLLGRAEDLGRGRRWRVPRVIDFGVLTPRNTVSRWVGFETIGEITCRAELAGLRFEIQDQGGGQQALHLILDGAELSVGTLVEGRLELAAGGLITLVRLTGQVVAEGSPAAEAAAGSRDALSVPMAEALRRIRERPTPPPTPAPPRSVPASAGAVPANSATSSPLFAPGATGGTRPTSRLIGSGLQGAIDLVVEGGPPVAPPSAGGPASAADLLQQARVAALGNDTDMAVSLYQRALALAPSDARAHAELAELQARRHDVVAAVSSWEQVLKLDPGYAGARLGLARCFNRLERFEDAVTVLEEAVGRGDSDLDTLQALAMAYAAAERWDEAFWALDRVAASGPDARRAARLTALRQAWIERRGY